MIAQNVNKDKNLSYDKRLKNEALSQAGLMAA